MSIESEMRHNLHSQAGDINKIELRIERSHVVLSRSASLTINTQGDSSSSEQTPRLPKKSEIKEPTKQNRRLASGSNASNKNCDKLLTKT